jgi:hypothetical protein
MMTERSLRCITVGPAWARSGTVWVGSVDRPFNGEIALNTIIVDETLQWQSTALERSLRCTTVEREWVPSGIVWVGSVDRPFNGEIALNTIMPG